MALATGCVRSTTATRRALKLPVMVTVAILMGSAVPARAADAVTFWNEVANTMTAPRGPASMVDMAKVHIAIHDAVQSFELRFETYCATIPNASGSPSAATAKAARDVLAGILPLTPPQLAALDATYNTFLSNNGLVGNAGIATGQQAAACILQMRANDGSFPASFPPFNGDTEPGAWRPTATPPVSMATPWLGSVVPFALHDATQLRPAPGPPALTSGLYARDYNEAKAVGAKFSTTRTGDQTELANFYSDNFLVLMQRNLRTIAETMGTDLAHALGSFAGQFSVSPLAMNPPTNSSSPSLNVSLLNPLRNNAFGGGSVNPHRFPSDPSMTTSVCGFDHTTWASLPRIVMGRLAS